MCVAIVVILELIYHNHVVPLLRVIILVHSRSLLTYIAHGHYYPSHNYRHQHDDQQNGPRWKGFRRVVVSVMSVVFNKAAVVCVELPLSPSLV